MYNTLCIYAIANEQSPLKMMKYGLLTSSSLKGIFLSNVIFDPNFIQLIKGNRRPTSRLIKYANYLNRCFNECLWANKGTHTLHLIHWIRFRLINLGFQWWSLFILVVSKRNHRARRALRLVVDWKLYTDLQFNRYGIAKWHLNDGLCD